MSKEREILDKTIRDAQGVIDKAKRDLEGLNKPKHGDYGRSNTYPWMCLFGDVYWIGDHLPHLKMSTCIKAYIAKTTLGNIFDDMKARP